MESSGALKERPAVPDAPPPAINGARRPAFVSTGWSGGSATHRTVSLVAAVGLFSPLFAAWTDVVAVPSAGVATVLLTGATLWMIVAIATARTEAELERLDRWLLVLGLLALAAWGAARLQQMSGTGTDEAAFIQGAANALLHGHDPYGTNLTSSLTAYGVPPAFWTYTLGGGHVSTLGYPALPVLLVAPFAAVLGSAQATSSADLVILAVATVVMYRMLPRELRAVAVIVCIGFPNLAGFALAGMAGIAMMAALLLVAYRWHSIGEDGRLEARGRWSAVALGLAVCANQLAWFIAPFVVAGIFLARREQLGMRAARRLGATYTGIAVAVAALLNAPFIVWNAHAWLNGVLAPLSQHALPYGQGLIGITLFARVGGGALGFYTYASALLYLALLALYVIDFRVLHRCCFVFPIIAFYLSGRSLGAYWMILVAVFVIGAMGEAPSAGVRVPTRGGAVSDLARRLGPWLRVALFLPAAACLAVALATPAPLALHVLGGRSEATTDTVRQVTVAVANQSDDSLKPLFATNTIGQASAFWTIARGPRVLGPRRRATYVLTIADVTSMPQNSTPFVVQAVTATPYTISSSPAYSQPGPVPQG
jgi:hypothetical protein